MDPMSSEKLLLRKFARHGVACADGAAAITTDADSLAHSSSSGAA